ncbi:gamma-type small acid-soluble spore protein [Bacillus sp. NPDC094106]|uniref:gamma-type small acid-soluble spore protein n=1 Tax=Bacillus sp. NPDC094106 TaxID=3363949 RepID=UPI0037FEBEBA
MSYKHYNKEASSSNIHNTNASYGIEFATDTDVHTVRTQHAKSAAEKLNPFGTNQ